jgi:Ca-activated chloride channel family protein
MKWWIRLSLLFALLGTVPAVSAAGLIIVDEAYWWPGPGPIPPPRPIPPWPRPPWPTPPWPHPPRQPHLFAPLEVSSVKVNTRIKDQISATSIEQEFYNPNNSQLEGTFVFPVPKGAHLDKFTMEIDGKKVQAELMAADKARGIYEDIVRRLKDPGLLEYAGRDVFKVRIFPIEPHGRKRITISYTQLLKSDGGLVTYTLPLNAERFSAKPIKDVSVKVELESTRPLKSIYSPSHKVDVKRDGANRATAGYEANDVHADSDFALYFAPEKDEIGLNLLTHKVSGEDGYFLLLASPGVDVKEKQVVSKDIAFVLDTSGSMAGPKLEQAKKALLFCVENLNDGDRFEIIRFSTEVEPLFEKLVDASRANRARANNYIKELKPMGATAIDDALKKALALRPAREDRPFVVIFLTDGRPTIGTTDEDEILTGVRKRGESSTRVFCFGIGTDVNTHLLDRITEETRAFSQYVLPEEDLEVKVSSFFSKIKEPVLSNPVLKFTGDIRVTKLYPSPLPDLFKGEQLVLVGRYSGKGDAGIGVEGTVNGAIRKFGYEARLPEESSENEFIPQLWATRRVGYLLDEIRLHGEKTELRDEVTDLARKYAIVTPFTAYLIIEDETRQNVPVRMRSLQSFESDVEARREAAANWQDYKTKRDGEQAVAGARYGLQLKAADAAAPAALNGAIESQRALGLPTQSGSATTTVADSGKTRLMQYAQQSEFVGGKTFFLNDQQWIDSAVQKVPNAKRERVQFGSSEYFNLLRQDARVGSWLALGQNVHFLLDNTIYEIYD